MTSKELRNKSILVAIKAILIAAVVAALAFGIPYLAQTYPQITPALIILIVFMVFIGVIARAYYTSHKSMSINKIWLIIKSLLSGLGALGIFLAVCIASMFVGTSLEKLFKWFGQHPEYNTPIVIIISVLWAIMFAYIIAKIYYDNHKNQLNIKPDDSVSLLAQPTGGLEPPFSMKYQKNYPNEQNNSK